MLFSKDFLFVHAPKTGGMSVTRWLLNNYMGEMFLSVPASARDHAIESFEFPDVRDRVTIVEGTRHESLVEAEEVVRRYGYGLSDFKVIVAVARHPYQLERSYHSHLQRPAVSRLRRASGPKSEIAYAKSNSLLDFIKYCSYYGNYPSKIEEYFEIDGVSPPNMHIVKMENLVDDLERVLGPYVSNRMALERRNQSAKHEEAAEVLDNELLAALVRKQPFLCRLYGLELPESLETGTVPGIIQQKFGKNSVAKSTADLKSRRLELDELIESSASGQVSSPIDAVKLLKGAFAKIRSELDKYGDLHIAQLGWFRKKLRPNGETVVVFKPLKRTIDAGDQPKRDRRD